jgi:flagellar basal body-associated protein FliL
MPDVKASPAQSTASRSTVRKVVVVAIGATVALVAAASLVIWGPQRATSASGDAAESAFALETFVVNLTGSSQRAYLRIGITLGTGHRPTDSKGAAAVPMAQVRDTILSVLATAQPEELLQIEGKRRLKDELLKALQERVPQLAIRDVYFTEFLVQM